MLLSVASRIVAANVRAREPLLFRKYDLFRIQNRRRRRTRHSCGADILCRCLADLVRYWIMLRTRCECIRSLSLHSSHSEPCAFLYDSELNIVVLQRSPHVSHAAFARLVNWAADTAFFFLPVLNEDAMTRLEKLHKLRRFVLTVASPQTAEYLDDLESSLKGLAPFVRELAGSRVRIDVGILPKSQYLSKDAILHTVGALLDRLDDERLEKLEVDGEDEEGNNQIVDFIDAQFRGHEALAETAPRHTDIGLLKDSIRKAFDTGHIYLSTHLRSRAAQAQQLAVAAQAVAEPASGSLG